MTHEDDLRQFCYNLYPILRERLESYRDAHASAAIIHECNSQLGRITSWKSLYEHYKDIIRLVTWREYMRSAEIYLESQAKLLKGDRDEN